VAANVFAAALRHSESEGNDRNVLLALADAAWRDGVTWILVGDDKHDEDETICRLARVSRATVWRSLKSLKATGEVQMVRVRRGRSFVTVYRVLAGAVDVDYERIPFELPHRFDEEPPAVQRRNLQRSDLTAAESESTTGPVIAAEADRCNMKRSDERSTFQAGGFNVSAPRAGVDMNRKRTEKSNSNNAAAALLEKHLRDLGVSAKVRRAALADPERAKAWLELAATAASVNPAGFFVAGFTGGEWPSRRADDRETASTARAEWIANTSPLLDAEDAHAIVDDWRDLDDVERAELHEQVDQVRQARTESEAA